MIEVRLQKDSCRIYKVCHKILKQPFEWSVLDLSNAKMNPTARNRLNYSLKNGYSSKVITWEERNSLLNTIHEINTSANIRQGMKMSKRYKSYPKVFTDKKKCTAHYSQFLGCFNDKKLVGYIKMLFCGEIAVATDILGHAQHLRNACMLNLWSEFITLCRQKEIKYIIYGRAEDGSEGLKYWKYSVGLKPELIKESNAENENGTKQKVSLKRFFSLLRIS